MLPLQGTIVVFIEILSNYGRTSGFLVRYRDIIQIKSLNTTGSMLLQSINNKSNLICAETLFLKKYFALQIQFQSKTRVMEPTSTLQNSLRWKAWHSINYLIGGISFFIGSVTLFPHLNRYFPAAIISAWFYTIGSFTFLLADITEWLHYVYWNCKYLWYAFNFLLSVIGSAMYLVGSACFLPQIKQNNLGFNIFVFGSSFVIVAQTFKLLKVFSSSKLNFRETFKEDPSGVFVDFFAGIGGMGYWIGSVNPNLAYQVASFFTLGGIFFTLSAIFMQKRYYCEQPVQENSLMPSDQ